MDLSAFYTGDQQLDQTVIDQDLIACCHILWKTCIVDMTDILITYDLSCR